MNYAARWRRCTSLMTVPSAMLNAAYKLGFHRGDYHRLRVGPYRVKYVIDGDMITIERVDRVI